MSMVLFLEIDLTQNNRDQPKERGSLLKDMQQIECSVLGEFTTEVLSDEDVELLTNALKVEDAEEQNALKRRAVGWECQRFRLRSMSLGHASELAAFPTI
jgi:hypothetical protein